MEGVYLVIRVFGYYYRMEVVLLTFPNYLVGGSYLFPANLS